MDNRENVRKESKKAVLIIIPAYNEEKNIVPLLEKLEQYMEINSGFRKIYIQFDFS